MEGTKHELAGIVRQYREAFVQHCRPLGYQLKVLDAIASCRTAALGGHVDQCNSCKHIRISYNSCRNRHCPKCQSTQRERWIEARQQQLIPVKYFHVVFTLPQELNRYCLHFPKLLYNLLFATSKATVETFASDKKHLGAIPGMVSVLHTWGQNLMLHPHIHMIVPAGGFTACGFWKHTRQKGKFLFPVKAMSIVYKNKFMEGLLALIKEQNLPPLPSDERRNLYNKPWVVFSKQPFGGPEQVIEYLGRYTHKVAISNHRITAMENDTVTFRYKDYADGGKQKRMTLAATEFLRRFCLHILPGGFRKIRHYGFLSNRCSQTFKQQQMQMGVTPVKQAGNWKQIAKEKLQFDVDQCPCCKKGKMEELLSFDINGPPAWVLLKLQLQETLLKKGNSNF
jgi:hypothetical protein